MGALAALLAVAAPAAAQVPANCPAGEDVAVDFGIQGLTSRQMEFHVRTVDGVRVRDVTFGAEPTVTAVRAGGPAVGRLRSGDVIAAIDGRLITTRAGGERWSTVRPGEDVTFTVRRSGREERVTVTAGVRCVTPVAAPPATPSLRAGRAPGAVAAPPAPGAPPAPPAPVVAVAPPAPLPPLALPEGWFGFSIRCSDCSYRYDPDRASAVFEFLSAPEIQSVEPGTPAAEAGLLPGDLLVAMDGVALTTVPGGAAFANVSPGQAVRFSVRRGARALAPTLRAVARRGAEGPVAGVGRLRATAAGVSVGSQPRTLRYTGKVGNAVVEVRGGPSVTISEVRENGDVIIRVGDTEVRVTAGSGGG